MTDFFSEKRPRILLGFLTGLLLALSFAFPASASGADARRLLEERTVEMWIDAQFLDDLVLNARAYLSVTWLPRALTSKVNPSDIPEWASAGLAQYSSPDPEKRKKLAGRDVLALNYRAEKNWDFDPLELRVGGRQVTSDDLLGTPHSWVFGPLASGTSATLYLSVPPLKKGRTVRIALGPDSADLKVPLR